MPDLFDELFNRTRAAVEKTMEAERSRAVDEEKASLSRPGSPVPFVASKPGEPSRDWYPGSPESMVAGIRGFLRSNQEGVTVIMISDAVDHEGHHYSSDAEFGSFWDGWAFDPKSGKMVKIAPAHFVAPRPHHEPQFFRSVEQIDKNLPTALAAVGAGI